MRLIFSVVVPNAVAMTGSCKRKEGNPGQPSALFQRRRRQREKRRTAGTKMFDDRGLKNAADAAVAMMKVFWCGEKAQ